MSAAADAHQNLACIVLHQLFCRGAVLMLVAVWSVLCDGINVAMVQQWEGGASSGVCEV